MSFGITLARPALMFDIKTILSLYTGEAKFAHNLQTYLLSRDHSNLKSEFQDGNGKKIVDSIEQQPDVGVVVGEHVFLTVGDYYLTRKSD
ncbi:isoleucine--tRNA ligase, cytoplasmic-like [Abrus precatorius]|uniref:Isoleucine--tRNA ligase, cytoplasmic-like n=1 Tax=Abrus precatorius TaxID=3816 RepID=A0A8B8LJQ1_ABRPR|nr:isoleucine--tRNA ligase, cytoplasmic-like [Abrus precatorius]